MTQRHDQIFNKIGLVKDRAATLPGNLKKAGIRQFR